MKKLSKTHEEILNRYYDSPDSPIWDCHGTLVIYHAAIEQMASKAGIQFDPPTVLSVAGADTVAICVSARMGDKTEWATGEAAPKNNKNAYPWAMAEKRAKDRAAIKLLGLYGLYSEDEADDFKPAKSAAAQTEAPNTGNPPGITAFRAKLREFYRELNSCADYDQYVVFVNSPESQDFLRLAREQFPNDWNGDGGDVKGLKRDMQEIVNSLKEKEAA